MLGYLNPEPKSMTNRILEGDPSGVRPKFDARTANAEKARTSEGSHDTPDGTPIESETEQLIKNLKIQKKNLQETKRMIESLVGAGIDNSITVTPEDAFKYVDSSALTGNKSTEQLDAVARQAIMEATRFRQSQETAIREAA
ncbi:MAG: hypothetical protein WC730_03500 [Patescibacteria group bacterium]|jgi:hypothetical protein